MKNINYRCSLGYIHNNPVKAELVGRPEDYIYSSVRYSGEKGLDTIRLST